MSLTKKLETSIFRLYINTPPFRSGQKSLYKDFETKTKAIIEAQVFAKKGYWDTRDGTYIFYPPHSIESIAIEEISFKDTIKRQRGE